MMLIVEEDGYSFMLTGVNQKAIDDFFGYLENLTSYSGVVGCSKFCVPKDDKIVEVFIIDCLNSKDGRRESLEYWQSKGVKYTEENVQLLNI